MDNRGFTWAALMLADLCLMIAGLFILYRCMHANDALLSAVQLGTAQHFSGMDVPETKHWFVAMMSGGGLTLVPIWQIRIAYLVGGAMTYFGVLGLALHLKQKELRVVFTRRYWTNFYTRMDDI